jgi:hypothetical protein
MTRLLPLFALLLLSCESHPECALGEYESAECRVAAENHYARIKTSTGVEVRFQPMGAAVATSWDALGLVQEIEPGVVRLRPAALMGFNVSFTRSDLGGTSLRVVVDNIAPDMLISLGTAGSLQPQPGPTDHRMQREFTFNVPEETIFLRGSRPCPADYRIAVAADIQTNPLQFERIVQDLHQQLDDGEAAGQPLLGLLLLGDLTESASDDEFIRIEEMLTSSPVPVAVTVGNHDKAGDEFARFNRYFGPGNIAFDVCDTRVVLLDTGDGAIAPSIEARLPELFEKGDADHLIMGTHYVIYPDRTGQGLRDEDQAWYILSELVRNGAERLMTGHAHYWKEYPAVPIGDGTIHEIITGTGGASQGEGHPRYGTTRLTFTDAGVDSCFYEVPPPGTEAPYEGSVTDSIDFCTTD